MSITISYNQEDFEYDFIDENESVVFYNTVDGSIVSYSMSLYDLFNTLGMSDSDMEKEFDAQFMDGVLSLESINYNKVVEYINNLSLADFHYVYMKKLIDDEKA